MQKSVNTIIQNGAGKYLLQMRDGTPGICNPLKWNFFGGSIDNSEDPIAGAVRETKEELNIALGTEDFELLGELCPREDRLVYVVRCTRPMGWGEINLQEGAGAGYFTKDELPRLDITDATRMLVEKYLRLSNLV